MSFFSTAGQLDVQVLFKKRITGGKLFGKTFIAITLGIVISIGGMTSVPAEAKTYKNCTELRKDFPGGIAKSKSVKNKGGEITKVPTVNAKLYSQISKKMDRDNDGIACES